MLKCETIVKHFAKLRGKPGFYLKNAILRKAYKSLGFAHDIEYEAIFVCLTRWSIGESNP